MNHNVRVSLAASLAIGLADSIWNGTVLASYCYDLGKSNTFVGLVEAANGLVQLLVGPPIGAYADGSDKGGVTRKVRVVRAACPLTTAASVLTALVTWVVTFGRGGRTSELKWLLIFVMTLWGLTEAVVMGPFQATFADSVPTGDRSRYYSMLYATYIGASAAGPAVSIALFRAWGNTWSPRQLAKVLLSGMALEIAASPLFLLLKESELLGGQQAAAAQELSDDDDEEDGGSNKKRVLWGADIVPYLLFASSMLSALGSGMTVKFFPLFFRNTVNLAPITVQIVYTTVPVAMVFAMAAAQAMHKLIGRVQTMVACRLTAVTLLVAMIFLIPHARGAHSTKYVVLLVVVYVTRTALANCTYPIEESILMDFVPSRKRARWKSLESIASFGWCGSALVGGLVADRYSYSTTFAVTATLQFLAALLTASLTLIVPRFETQLKRAQQQSLQPQQQQQHTDGDDDVVVYTPLPGGGDSTSSSAPGPAAAPGPPPDDDDDDDDHQDSTLFNGGGGAASATSDLAASRIALPTLVTGVASRGSDHPDDSRAPLL